jgi:hypothetical protein
MEDVFVGASNKLIVGYLFDVLQVTCNKGLGFRFRV